MPRVVIDPAVPDGKVLDKEIARLRGLDLEELQARWHTAFRRRAPSHLPRHLKVSHAFCLTVRQPRHSVGQQDGAGLRRECRT
jgi:hypothetical protein